MRTLTSLFAAGLLACSMSAIAADDSVSAPNENTVNANDVTNTDRNDSADSATNAAADDGRGSDANADDQSGNNDDLARNDADSATDRTANDGRGTDANADNQGSVVRDGTAKAEYNNECAWGLANGQHVQTSCAVNMTGENGKTYCFSSDKAMAAFMKDPARNMSKADSTYGRS